MSGKSRSLIRTQITNILLPKSLLRAGNAGVIVGTLGGSNNDVRLAQEGFASGDFQEVTVWGVDAEGKAHDKVTFRVDRNNDGEELVAISDDDSTDYVTRTDPGMAQGLRYTAARFLRKGLTARPVFDYAQEVRNDPDRLARARAKYNTYPAPAPEPAPGYAIEHVATIRPARDKFQLLSIFRGRRSR
jgi:hypothetical protein